MPIINADTLEAHQTTASGYSYSGATIDEKIAPEQTLFTLFVDRSGSVQEFEAELEECVRHIVAGCKKDPRADYQMLRVLLFGDDVVEYHGFKPLVTCNPDDYRDFLKAGGQTALFEAGINATEATDDYAAKLKERDRDANAIIVGITDGMDNRGHGKRLTVKSLKQAFDRLVTNENVESCLPILIGVNMKDNQVRSHLATVEAEGGFAQFLAIEDANADTFAKIAGFVSQSVSAQSQHINTGGPSQPVNPTGFNF